MHLRISTLPELQVLDAHSRKQLLARHVDWLVRIKLAILPLAAGIVPIIGGIQLLRVPDWIFCALLFISFGAFVAGYVYLYQVNRIRLGIREALQLAMEDGMRIVCLKCGYDISASPSDLCPECGHSLGSKNSQIRR